MTRAGAVRIAVTGDPAAAATFARTISSALVLSHAEPAHGSGWDEPGPPTDQPGSDTDFGRVSLPGGPALHLLLPPSGQALVLAWPELREGLLGHVLVVAADDPDELLAARAVLDLLGGDPPAVLAVDGLNPARHAAVRLALDLPERVPLVACDVTDRAAVKAALLTLLGAVLSGLDMASADDGAPDAAPTDGAAA